MKKAIIMFGPPGCGKGTHSALLAKKLSFSHISTGQILRDSIEAGNLLGKKVAPLIKAGNLVPDELVLGLIEEFISKNKSSTGLIFDGFPRTLKQARLLHSLFEKHMINDVSVVNLRVNKDELINRILARAKAEGRADDNLETVKNRFGIYEEQTAPILSFYASLIPENVQNISTENEIEAVHRDILNSLK